jgi:hypothetical protein
MSFPTKEDGNEPGTIKDIKLKRKEWQGNTRRQEG